MHIFVLLLYCQLEIFWNEFFFFFQGHLANTEYNNSNAAKVPSQRCLLANLLSISCVANLLAHNNMTIS